MDDSTSHRHMHIDTRNMHHWRNPDRGNMKLPKLTTVEMQAWEAKPGEYLYRPIPQPICHPLLIEECIYKPGKYVTLRTRNGNRREEHIYRPTTIVTIGMSS